MAICPEGHQSRAQDYCDECGLPISEGAPAAASSTQAEPVVRGQQCPHCRAMNPADALFCEACGYDFVTGTLPRGSLAELLRQPFGEAPPPDGQPVSEPALESEPGDEVDAAVEPRLGAESEAPSSAMPETEGPVQVPVSAQGVEVLEPLPADLETPQPETDQESEIPTSSRPAPPSKKRWVAEMWIDPDWYRLQESPDPLPSPGLPDIFPLPGPAALIGRVSRSQRIDPDVDCGTDTGCSRRHAQLTTDGVRWWIEDLGSANGTFVGETNGALPTTPITGRTELTDDSRIYIGGWTRIVVRPATPEEDGLF